MTFERSAATLARAAGDADLIAERDHLPPGCGRASVAQMARSGSISVQERHEAALSTRDRPNF